MKVFSRILTEYPVKKTGDLKTDNIANRTRVFAIKQLTIDLYDEMEILRGRHRKSKATEKDVAEEFADWAPQ